MLFLQSTTNDKMSNRRKPFRSPFRTELSFGKFQITNMSFSELKFLYRMIVIDDFLTALVRRGF